MLQDIKNEVRPVGKHGFVRLLDWMGDDSAIVDAARVSMGAGTKIVREDRDLIRYMMRKGHTSPFEHCEIKLHLRVPMDTWRQWIRNRTACLSGDTKIDLVNEHPAGRKSITVEEAYQEIQAHPERKTALRVYCYNTEEKIVGTNYIAQIHKLDEKPVYQMFCGLQPTSVGLTSDHRCLTNKGWLQLKEILDMQGKEKGSVLLAKPDTMFMCMNLETKEILEGKDIKFVYSHRGVVYDVEIAGAVPHFTVKGLIVHNSVNEHSTRYSNAIDEKETTDPDRWRYQHPTNKQGSGAYLPKEIGIELSNGEAAIHALCRTEYEKRIGACVAREQARKDLPLSNLTEAYWKIDLHNLLHNFLAKRLHPDAQLEIRQYAQVISDIVKTWVPYTWEAFEDYVLGGMKLSKQEQDIISSRDMQFRLLYHPLSTGEVRELKDKCARLGIVLNG